jgi:glycine cleavage system aminomethyltransferase T
VSVFAPSEGAAGPLDPVLRQAGAVFSSRSGRPVAIHYGSAAGELSVCVSAVGVADRSDLCKLEIKTPGHRAAAELSLRLAGAQLHVGGAVWADGAWWCGLAPDRILVLAERAAGARLVERLRIHALHHVVRSVRDRSAQLAGIALLGPGARDVLAAIGVYGPSGDPRLAPPFGSCPVAGVDVAWLLKSDRSALAVTACERAADVWRAIELAGRPFGISCVGREAAGRYVVLEHARERAATRSA